MRTESFRFARQGFAGAAVLFGLLSAPGIGLAQPASENVFSGLPLKQGARSLRIEELVKALESQSEMKNRITSRVAYDSLRGADSKVQRGGDVSGGGSYIRVGDRSALLDLYVANASSAFTAAKSQVALAELRSRAQGELSLAPVDLGSSRFGAVTRRAAERLATVSPRLSQLFLAVFENTPFYLAKGWFPFVDANFYFPPTVLEQLPESAEIGTAALFLRGWGVVLSLPALSAMSDASVEALPVHEVLRIMQIQYGLQLTNAEIQEITAALVREDDSLSAVVTRSGLWSISEKTEKKSVAIQTICAAEKEAAPILARIQAEKFASVCEAVQAKVRQAGSGLDEFEALANGAADLSHEILARRVDVRQDEAFVGERVALEEIEDRLDFLTAQMRAALTSEIVAKALPKVAPLIGSLMKSKATGIYQCSNEYERTPECRRLEGLIQSVLD